LPFEIALSRRKVLVVNPAGAKSRGSVYMDAFWDETPKKDGCWKNSPKIDTLEVQESAGHTPKYGE
jgi:hypothetical protein